jgi:hypothetical protein
LVTPFWGILEIVASEEGCGLWELRENGSPLQHLESIRVGLPLSPSDGVTVEPRPERASW